MDEPFKDCFMALHICFQFCWTTIVTRNFLRILADLELLLKQASLVDNII